LRQRPLHRDQGALPEPVSLARREVLAELPLTGADLPLLPLEVGDLGADGIAATLQVGEEPIAAGAVPADRRRQLVEAGQGLLNDLRGASQLGGVRLAGRRLHCSRVDLDLGLAESL